MAWFALLFAAGMGIGLVFYGVSEPLSHFASPRPGVTGTPAQLAQQALSQTYLHWGVHAWSIYVVIGLALAYAIHRRSRPISIRWTLEPLLGNRVPGGVGQRDRRRRPRRHPLRRRDLARAGRAADQRGAGKRRPGRAHPSS